MSLLTPSESHAFQSFLSSIDYDYSIVESLVASADWTSIPDDMGIPVPHAGPAKEALAKATKDLITLPPAPPSASTTWEASELKDHAFFKPLRLPHNPSTFGSHPSVQQDVHKQRNEFDHLQSIVNHSSSLSHSRAAPSRLHRSSISASSSSSSVTTLAGPSRPLPSKRSHSEESSSSSTSHKRQRPSPSRSGGSTPSQAIPGSKPALLSASQKKANHIQSEQKRRANIRRGYEALCETIPALREAIRAEEEASSGLGPGGKKRRARGRVSDDGEKVDGRAGPRSENIVLAKSEPPYFFSNFAADVTHSVTQLSNISSNCWHSANISLSDCSVRERCFPQDTQRLVLPDRRGMCPSGNVSGRVAWTPKTTMMRVTPAATTMNLRIMLHIMC
jgi:hypothetical protein